MKNQTRPARIRRRILAVGVPVVALLVGVGIGTSSQPEPRVETKVETREVEVPVEVEKEVEVEVEVTPEVCTSALDQAETVISLAADGFGVVETMFDAASSFDVAGMNAGSARLDAMQPDLAAAVASYNEEAEACRAN